LVLADETSRGPLSGVLAGLDWAAAKGATHVVSAAVDTPFFPCDLVPQLCLAAEGHAASLAIARAGGRDHPTFGLWPVSLREDLRRYLEKAASARVLGFVDHHQAARADFADPDAFANLNTPDDLDAAQRRWDLSQ
jgi:molybdenum cofactor guanylyltransferase